MIDEQDSWMTVEEVADLLSVTVDTIRRWIRAGELPVLALGSRKAGYRIRRSDLDAFLAERYGPVGKEIAA